MVDVYGDCTLHTASSLTVWIRCAAFGVTMYELMAMQAPWHGIRSTEIYQKVYAGERPSAGYPDDAMAEWTELMQHCWSQNVDARPAFGDILARLQTLKAGVEKDMQQEQEQGQEDGGSAVDARASLINQESHEASNPLRASQQVEMKVVEV